MFGWLKCTGDGIGWDKWEVTAEMSCRCNADGSGDGDGGLRGTGRSGRGGMDQHEWVIGTKVLYYMQGCLSSTPDSQA